MGKKMGSSKTKDWLHMCAGVSGVCPLDHLEHLLVRKMLWP